MKPFSVILLLLLVAFDLTVSPLVFTCICLSKTFSRFPLQAVSVEYQRQPGAAPSGGGGRGGSGDEAGDNHNHLHHHQHQQQQQQQHDR